MKFLKFKKGSGILLSLTFLLILLLLISSNQIFIKAQTNQSFNLSAKGDCGFVNLEWNKVEGAVWYYIYRGIGEGNEESMPLTDFPIKETAYKDTKEIKEGVKYCYYVKALDEKNTEIARSIEACAIPTCSSGEEKPEDCKLILQFKIGDVYYWVNGEQKGPMLAAPILRWDRTFLIIRHAVEEVGGEIFWDGTKKTVTIITKEGKKIEFQIDSNMYKVNGISKHIDPYNLNVVPFIQNGRTLLPLRVTGDELNAKEINWYADKNIAELIFPCPEKPKGGINANITYHSYDAKSGWVAFHIQNTGSLNIECVESQIVNRSTGAIYYGGPEGYYSDQPFDNTPKYSQIKDFIDNLLPGDAKYLSIKLKDNPIGVPCRATFILYSEDHMGGISTTKIVDFDLPAEVGTSIYFADGYQSKGAVYYYDSVTNTETTIYTRPSGNLYSFLFAPWDTTQLYFVNANEYKIYKKLLGGGIEEVVYTHSTYVRDIAVKDGALYFSEATGSGGDGKIWCLSSSKTPTLFYQVKLSEVNGFWSGDFTFDKNGLLYLSSGNKTGASLYRVDIVANTVTKLFTDPEPITGMAFGEDGFLYYANWGTKIYCLDLTNMTKSIIYNGPNHRWISDVGFKSIASSVITPDGVNIWVMPWGIGDMRLDTIKSSGLIDYTDAMSNILMTDAPFGGRLGFRHGASSSIPNSTIKYYRWQYKGVGGSWVDFFEPVYIYYVLDIPGQPPILMPYKLGPNPKDGMNLYEFRPDSSTLPKPVSDAKTYWVSSGLMFTEYSGFWQTAATDIAPGEYDIRLTVYNSAGVQTLPDGAFQFVVPDFTAPGGEIHTRTALSEELDSGGFRFKIVVDNRSCTATIETPKIGNNTADNCGILRYKSLDDKVNIAFRAYHPADFGVFSFQIYRGSTDVPTTRVSMAEVKATTAGAYTKNAFGYFEHGFDISTLLDTCTEAAFSENLHIYAKATTGNGYRIGAYDASAVQAFALFGP